MSKSLKLSVLMTVIIMLLGCKGDMDSFLHENRDDIKGEESNSTGEKFDWDIFFTKQDNEEEEIEELAGTFTSLEFTVYEDDVEIGKIELDAWEPKRKHRLAGGVSIDITHYYPNYEMRDGEPVSIGKSPYNPAMLFNIKKGSVEESSFVGVGINVTVHDDPFFDIKLTDTEMVPNYD